jgi:hypothetical protein
VISISISHGALLRAIAVDVRIASVAVVASVAVCETNSPQDLSTGDSLHLSASMSVHVTVHVYGHDACRECVV